MTSYQFFAQIESIQVRRPEQERLQSCEFNGSVAVWVLWRRRRRQQSRAAAADKNVAARRRRWLQDGQTPPPTLKPSAHSPTTVMWQNADDYSTWVVRACRVMTSASRRSDWKTLYSHR